MVMNKSSKQEAEAEVFKVFVSLSAITDFRCQVISSISLGEVARTSIFGLDVFEGQ